MKGDLGIPVGAQVSKRALVSWFCGMTRERERRRIVSGIAAEVVSPMEWCGRGRWFGDPSDLATCGVRYAYTTSREVAELRHLARAHSQRLWSVWGAA